jgi:2-dehydro-3-deoxyphosphooctonate aldolase (KDO 8-P synthase)
MENLLQRIGNRQLVKEKDRKIIIIAGPCVIENPNMCMEIAGTMKEYCEEYELPYIFKASYDKANRTSIDSYRGPGLKEGLAVLNNVRRNYEIPILSDVHLPSQMNEAAKVLDIIQIPAFLCRQTDLLVEAGKTNKIINIKKGQFMSPKEMEKVIEKIYSTGNKKVLITERGTFFGYNRLVNDFRGMKEMETFAPVIYDATHSAQQPGSLGEKTGGDKKYIPFMIRAVVALGVYGIFMEVHPEPEKALSDSTTSLKLSSVKDIIEQIAEISILIKNMKKVDYI